MQSSAAATDAVHNPTLIIAARKARDSAYRYEAHVAEPELAQSLQVVWHKPSWPTQLASDKAHMGAALVFVKTKVTFDAMAPAAGQEGG